MREPDLVQEVWRGLLRFGEDVSSAWESMRDEVEPMLRAGKERLDAVGDEAAFHLDKAFVAALSKDPELYAEIRRAVRKLRRDAERTLHDWGLR